ncbi:MAG: outer membrane lipoprotein-sorting protein [Caulobacterales bacterium]
MRALMLLTSLAMLVFASAAPARAETPAEKGLAIAKEQDKRESGWKDYSALFAMTLRSAEGKEALRQMRMLNMEVKNDGDKSLTVFDAPKDVKGTALLTWSHKTADDDVWLYLPSLARVKRIASNNKSGAFMGSEFAFEDISSTEVEKYTYKYLRDEKLDGQDCTVVEQVPTYANSGYTKLVVWRDKAEYRTLKVDYYDRKSQHLKTMRQSDYKLYLDDYWFPGRYEVKNHLTGRSTTLLMQNYKFGNGYTPRDFDQTSLERAR